MASSPAKPPRLRGIQFVTLSLLMLAGIVNFLDRSSLSIANTTIRADLRLSATQIGALLSAFSLAYGLAQLPTGPLLDRLGTRLILGLAMSVWSLAQLATGLVRSFASFLLLRVGLGLGEAPFMPAGVKAVNDWFAIEDRGRAMSAVNMSSTIGLAVAPPLLTVIMLAFGWRRMFLIIGGLGLALAAAWYPLNRDREEVSLSAEEAAYLDAGRTVSSGAGISLSDWLGLFRLRTIWGMMLGFGGINYTAWLYLSWLPGYLQTARHVSLATSGWIVAVPFLAGSAGMFVNGVVADHLARRDAAPTAAGLMRSRKRLIVGSMICSAGCTLAVTHTATVTGAVAVISMALFFIHFAGTSGWGLVQVAAPGDIVASVGAIQNFGSFVCASVAPVLTGFILDHTHSFALALTICSAVTLAGALSYAFVVREPIEITSHR